jgi:hypothetical protein
MADLPAEILAKDRRIDELVDQADKLIADLGAITAALKERLKSAQGDVDQQKKITAKGRKPDG